MRKPIAVWVVVVGALACGVSKDEYAAKVTEADNLKRQLADTSGSKAALETKAADLERQLAATRQELDTVNRSHSQLELKTAKLEEKSGEYEKLAQSLQGQIAAGQVELSELKGRMTVKLRDRVLFPLGSARLTREGRQALDAVADAFKGLRGKNAIVAGHTDDVKVGPKAHYADNWELSTLRALSVVKYLQAQGVDPKMLGAAGFSEYRPVAANEDEEGRSRNRRIEIVLTAADYAPPEVDVKR